MKLPLFVSAKGLENLRHYKYSGVDNSLSARLFLNRFWEWAVARVPLWLAPNAITLIGGVCMACASLVCAACSPHFAEAVPGPALVCAAALIWLYQTADNIDGKQARRTKTGSPLGELFDHGVDALVMGLICIPVCAALRGGPMLSVVGSVVTMAPFYLSHWEEYHAGSLVMGALTGPTELINAVIALLLVAAALPSDFWLRPVAGVALNVVALCALVAGVAVIAALFARGVVQLTRPGGKAVTGATTAQALRQPLCYAAFLALCLCWALSTPAAVAAHPQRYVVAVTLLFAYTTQRLIVQRICKEPFVYVKLPLLPVGIAAVNGVLHATGCSLAFSPDAVAVAVLAAAALIEGVFVVSIIRQLSTFLGIRPFVITSRKSTP